VSQRFVGVTNLRFGSPDVVLRLKPVEDRLLKRYAELPVTNFDADATLQLNRAVTVNSGPHSRFRDRNILIRYPDRRTRGVKAGVVLVCFCERTKDGLRTRGDRG